MGFQITVRDARGQIAQGEYAGLYDPGDDGQVKAAAAAVCKASNRSMPSNARIEVRESAGRRWRLVREVIA